MLRSAFGTVAVQSRASKISAGMKRTRIKVGLSARNMSELNRND